MNQDQGNRKAKWRQAKPALWLFAALLAVPPAALRVGGAEALRDPGRFQVELADPAFPSRPPRVVEIFQSRERNGFPAGYAAQITTEVCMDKKCRIVEVTMHWNAVGFFDSLEYPVDKPLTKKEHEPFTAEDYAKLDRILRDRDSILARHSLAFLAKPADAAPAPEVEVDAWSGATPLTVKESVVEDAGYTTWVLWHWANGAMSQKLGQLTAQSSTPPFLKHLLRSADRTCVDFALQFLSDHHPADAQFMDDVLHVVETGDREHITLALRFLKNAVANKEVLHARLIRAASRVSPMYSPVILDFLAGEPDLPPATLEELTNSLEQLPYFQIHLILRILEQRRFCSAKTEADVSRLLAEDDFFIARRAYGFLSKQKLSPETGRKVQEFLARNRDRM